MRLSITCVAWSQCRDLVGSCVSTWIVNYDATSRDLVLQTYMHKQITYCISYTYKTNE